MSTKIYNGYISKLGIEELLVKFKALVPVFDDLKAKEYVKYLIKRTVYHIDENNLYAGGSLKAMDVFWQIHTDSEQKIHSTIKHGTRFPDIDFSANCVVFPNRKKTLILFYSDNDQVLRLWRNLKYVSDYHYQNQTDKPKNVSAALWKDRELDWDKVLGKEVAARAGYGFTFCNAYPPYGSSFEKHCSQWRLYVASREDRAAQLVKRTFMKKACDRIGTQYGESRWDYSGTIVSAATDEWKVYEKSKAYKKDLVAVRKGLPKINLELKNK